MNILELIERPRNFRRTALVVFGIALLVRFGVLAFFWPTWDWHRLAIPDQWNELAINLVDHGSFAYSSDPTNSSTMRGPVFPWMEIPLYLVFGQNYAFWSVSLLVFDSFTCLLLTYTVCRLFGPRSGILAGIFYAVNIPIVYYTADIAQVTSVLPFVVAWLYLFCEWERRYFSIWLPVALGLVTGLMVLNKTVYLPVPVVASLMLWWTKRKDIMKIRQLTPIAVYVLLTITVVSPWTYRNYSVTKGSFVPVQSMFWDLIIEDIIYHDLDVAVGRDRPDGQSLKYYLAREDEILIAAGMSTVPPPGARAEWEVQRQKVFAKAAVAMIRADPWRLVKIKLANIWQYWVRAENWSKTRRFIVLQLCPLAGTIAGLAGLARYRQLGRVRYCLLLILVLWSEHCVVWGWGRLSLDLVPAMATIFGLGVDLLLRRGPMPIGQPSLSHETLHRYSLL